ncbi:MAG: hypothetical protein U0235_24370 [Polyangiaceae bacterium]
MTAAAARSLDALTPLDREVELLVSDVALARAWFEGMPAARLLARVRLGRSNENAETWDALLASTLGAPRGSTLLDRVERAIAKNLRGAQDDGPLEAAPSVVALLALAASASADASLGEIFSDDATVDPIIARNVARYEPRVASGAAAVRAAAFEACVRLAARRAAGPWAQGRVLHAARLLAASAIGPLLVADDDARLYPHDVDVAHSRMVLLARAPLEAVASKSPLDLAKAVSAIERTEGPAGLDSLIADVAPLLDHPGDIVFATPPCDPELDALVAVSVPPPSGPVSSVPLDWTQGESAASLASRFEAGLIALARLRQLVTRGGEPALDAIGAEMLNVTAHPAASAAFAEILAKSGRPRDLVRLVTYFAVTPDPLLAARALGECEAPELPSLLRAWLEAMLPTDGATPPPGDDPDTSSAARIAACVSSLEAYPHLYGAVRPLLSRVTLPPPSSG